MQGQIDSEINEMIRTLNKRADRLINAAERLMVKHDVETAMEKRGRGDGLKEAANMLTAYQKRRIRM